VLIWFCYDYFQHWFLASIPVWTRSFTPEIVAKSVACHTVLVLCMCLGLRLQIGKWIPRAISKLPEPGNPIVYFWIVILTQAVGMIPYVFFTSESFFTSLYHSIMSGRGGQGVMWSVQGRDGNENFHYGAYLAQVLQVGQGGAVLAAFYAVFLSRNLFQSVVCYAIWGLWLAMGFGSGTRGEVAFMLFPLIGFLFIKHSASAPGIVRKFPIRAYVIAGALLIFGQVLIQIQIYFRGQGFEDVVLAQVDVADVQGNSMLSEGLRGFEYIPQRHDYFYNKFPGEALIMPIPNLLFWGVIHPIPRVFWFDKPIDPAGPWYNDVATGGSGEFGGKVEGTTISEGLAGYWYFRFGIFGLIEGGLLVGWIMGMTERILLACNGKCLPILISLGLATWIFRCFRDMTFPEFYEMAIGVIFISIAVLVLRPLSGNSAPDPGYY
jgi:hypothetical protein